METRGAGERGICSFRPVFLRRSFCVLASRSTSFTAPRLSRSQPALSSSLGALRGYDRAVSLSGLFNVVWKIMAIICYGLLVTLFNNRGIRRTRPLAAASTSPNHILATAFHGSEAERSFFVAGRCVSALFFTFFHKRTQPSPRQRLTMVPTTVSSAARLRSFYILHHFTCCTSVFLSVSRSITFPFRLVNRAIEK